MTGKTIRELMLDATSRKAKASKSRRTGERRCHNVNYGLRVPATCPYSDKPPKVHTWNYALGNAIHRRKTPQLTWEPLWSFGG